MKRRTFTDEERSILLSHTDIVKVTAHCVSFSESFKRFALTEHAKGRRPQDIFITEGIPVSIIGSRIPERCIGAWRKMVNTHGIDALGSDKRGRPKILVTRKKKKEHIDEKSMTDAELIAYYKARIAYKEAENDFLARTRGIPRWKPFTYHSGSSTKS